MSQIPPGRLLLPGGPGPSSGTGDVSQTRERPKHQRATSNGAQQRNCLKGKPYPFASPAVTKCHPGENQMRIRLVALVAIQLGVSLLVAQDPRGTITGQITD